MTEKLLKAVLDSTHNTHTSSISFIYLSIYTATPLHEDYRQDDCASRELKENK